MHKSLESSMFSRFFTSALFAVLLSGTAAFARGGDTLDSLLPEIRAQHPGSLSDAEPFTAPDGSTHYRIKWMTPEGRILFFDADTRSGRFTPRANYDGGNDAGRNHDDGEDDGGRGSGRRANWDGGDDSSRWNGDYNRRDNGDWRGRGGWRDGQDGGGRWHDGRGDGGDWHGRGGDNGGRHHGRDN